MKLTRTFREQFSAYVSDSSTLFAYENIIELMLNHIQDSDLEEGIKKGFERSLLALRLNLAGNPTYPVSRWKKLRYHESDDLVLFAIDEGYGFECGGPPQDVLKRPRLMSVQLKDLGSGVVRLDGEGEEEDESMD